MLFCEQVGDQPRAGALQPVVIDGVRHSGTRIREDFVSLGQDGFDRFGNGGRYRVASRVQMAPCRSEQNRSRDQLLLGDAHQMCIPKAQEYDGTDRQQDDERVGDQQQIANARPAPHGVLPQSTRSR
jgi:hypothetical protein